MLTHTGTTFCAGADLAESAGEGGPAKGTQRLVALLRQIIELPKPVVAKVEGNVRAGGLGLLAACDLAVAGHSSSFAFTEARLGLAPAIISLTVLPRLTDRAASRYYLTGDRFDAAEAERIGLITMAADDPDGAVDAIAASLRACSPQGLAASKRLTTQGMLRVVRHRCPGTQRPLGRAVLLAGRTGGDRLVPGTATTALGRVSGRAR